MGPGYCVEEGEGTEEALQIDNLFTTTGQTNVPYLKAVYFGAYWVIGRKNFSPGGDPGGSDAEDIWLPTAGAPGGLRMVGVRIAFQPSA
ncbi:MAG: hypothetical protein LW834_18905, partial [Cyanobium sp. 49614_E6]|nr:hypothetical protein [Cyanobium sp. 49614_E6]